jgi:FMN phosphatase YigB (HAD superfamily)
MARRTQPVPLVFLVDVDNTLLDNDALIADLMRHLEHVYGASTRERYQQILEQVRSELGYVDYLGALQRYRLDDMCDARLLSMSSFLIDYPFANRLYPGALDAIKHVSKHGPAVILSDGDVVFQPRKIARSGLWEEVEGRVLIYIHKEQMLDQVMACYPARQYVMVDDKLRILTAMKKAWGEKLTTVFPRQGHYAFDPKEISSNPPADVTIERIGELADVDVNTLLSGGTAGGA